MSVVLPPFAYFGGKTTSARRIVGHLPAHRHYVEPFAGSLAVLLAKPQAGMETVNDLDGDLVVFWRVLRDRPLELARVCQLTPHSRAEFEAAAELEVADDLERARRVWVRLSQSRTGRLTRTGWRHYVAPGNGSTPFTSYLDAYVTRMAAAAERLHRVSLESRPALELIERYGAAEDVLLYVDPPYLGETRTSGRTGLRSCGRTVRSSTTCSRVVRHDGVVVGHFTNVVWNRAEKCRAIEVQRFPGLVRYDSLNTWNGPGRRSQRHSRASSHPQSHCERGSSSMVGDTTDIPRVTSRRSRAFSRAFAGLLPAEALSTRQRELLIATLHGYGWTDAELADHTMSTAYTVARIRTRLGLPLNAAAAAA